MSCDVPHNRPLDDMPLPHALLIGFLLLLGIPCLFFPRWMQRFVLAANERLGYVEPPSGFRRTPQYLRRLRFIGANCILFALLVAFLTLLTALSMKSHALSSHVRQTPTSHVGENPHPFRTLLPLLGFRHPQGR